MKPKFTDSDIIDIIREFSTGEFTQIDLGLKWGVNNSIISKIIKRQSYAKVELPDDLLEFLETTDIRAFSILIRDSREKKKPVVDYIAISEKVRKFSLDQANAIRVAAKKGISQKDLATRFGGSESGIRNVLYCQGPYARDEAESFEKNKHDHGRLTTEVFVERSNKAHNNKYTYYKTEYSGKDKKVIVTCSKHGDFLQLASNHLYLKNGCPTCNESKGEIAVRNFLTKTGRVFEAQKKFDDCRSKKPLPFDFFIPDENLLIEFQGIQHFQTVKGDFFGGEEALEDRVVRDQIKKEWVSKSEYDLLEVSYLDDVERVLLFRGSENNAIIDGLHFDHWFADKRIAVDFLHLLNIEEPSYRKKKVESCEKMGIKLITVFQDSWANKKDIVISRIENQLGRTAEKIYARKTVVKEVSSKEARTFLDTNHLQGFVGSKVKYGLYREDELVSLMTFSGFRKNLGREKVDGGYELTRFCSKLDTVVVGGANKLYKHFVREHTPNQVISYADRFWSSGELYVNLNFDFVRDTQSNYFYTQGITRENRFKYMKANLVKEGFDMNKTEKQIMTERGFNRVYDSGTKLFEHIYT